MHTSAVRPLVPEEQGSRLNTRAKWILAIACVLAGVVPFATHWISDDVNRTVCGLLLVGDHADYAGIG